MRDRVTAFGFARLVFSVSTAFALVFGVIGCGDDPGASKPTMGELPPEAKQASKNMQDFVKNAPAAAKKD